MNIFQGKGSAHLHVIGPVPTGKPFWGRRRELLELSDLLREGKYPVITVTSLQGEGKSALVSKALQVLCAELHPYDEIHWINCRSVMSSSYLFRRILLSSEDEWKDAITGTMSLDSLITVVMEKFRNGRILLVLDGIEALMKRESGNDRQLHFPEPIGRFLQGILCRDHGSQIVITSRMRLCANGFREYQTHQKEIFMAGLDEAASRNILSQTGVNRGLGRLSSIIHAIDGHPQLVRIIGQYIHDVHHGDATMFGSTMNGLSDKIAGWVTEQLRYINADARRLLSVLSVFQEPFRMQSLQTLVTGMNFDDVQPIIDELCAWHLLVQDEESGCYRIPPVVRSFSYHICKEKNELHRKLVPHYLGSPGKSSAGNGKQDMKNLNQAVRNALLGNDFQGAWSVLFDHGLAEMLRNAGCETQLGLLLDPLIRHHSNGKECSVPERLRAMITLGESHERRGDYSEAIYYFYQVLDLTTEMEGILFQRMALLGISRIYRITGHFNRSKELLKEAFKLCLKKKDPCGEAEVLYHFGESYLEYQQYLKAFGFFSQANIVLKNLPRPMLRGYIHLGLARTHFAMDERDKCLNCLEIAARVFREYGYRPGIRDVLVEKARILGYDGDEDLFSNAFREAIDFVQVNLPEIYAAKAWSVWGEILLERGNLSESLSLLEKSMEIYAGENDNAGVARQHFLVARTMQEIGDHGAAVKHMRESVTLVNSEGLKKETAEYLCYLGELYASKHQLPLAFVCFEKAAEMLDPSDMIGRDQMDTRMKNLEREIGSEKLNLLMDKIRARDTHFLSCALGAVNFPRFIHAHCNLV